MRSQIIISLAATLLFANAAPATELAQANQAATASRQKATEAPAPADAKKICKRIETSGTRMVERVCLTAEDWKKVEEQ